MADAGGANESLACKIQCVVECVVAGSAAADNDLLDAGHGVTCSGSYVCFIGPHWH